MRPVPSSYRTLDGRMCRSARRTCEAYGLRSQEVAELEPASDGERLEGMPRRLCDLVLAVGFVEDVHRPLSVEPHIYGSEPEGDLPAISIAGGFEHAANQGQRLTVTIELECWVVFRLLNSDGEDSLFALPAARDRRSIACR